MSTLNQFIKKYNGKYVDYDSWYGAQCVDIVQFWAKNLGTARFYGNAINIINQPGKDYIRINKTLTNRPRAGDIIVWKGWPADRRWGHTAICISSGALGFKSFDQNWPPNSPCHVQGHNYFGLAGWLRPKKLVASKPRPKPATKPTTSAVYYTVKGGDSLSAIANRFKVPMSKLITLNKARYPTIVKNPGLIQIGWKFRIK